MIFHNCGQLLSVRTIGSFTKMGCTLHTLEAGSKQHSAHLIFGHIVFLVKKDSTFSRDVETAECG